MNKSTKNGLRRLKRAEEKKCGISFYIRDENGKFSSKRYYGDFYISDYESEITVYSEYMSLHHKNYTLYINPNRIVWPTLKIYK